MNTLTSSEIAALYDRLKPVDKQYVGDVIKARLRPKSRNAKPKRVILPLQLLRWP